MRNFAIILILICAAAHLSAQPQIRLDSTEHDFGKIYNKGGAVEHAFRIVNTGTAPLLILQAESTCGCITTRFPKHPVAPGDTAAVTVRYDPSGQSGIFYRAIKILSNIPDGKTIVVVRGEVLKGKDKNR